MPWTSSTIVATPQTWNWRCPQPLTKLMKTMVSRALQSYLSFRAHFQAPKSIFENLFKIVLCTQIWLLVTLWMSQSDWEHISDHLQDLGSIWRKKVFLTFFNFFQAILAKFLLKNEAKMETTKSKIRFFQKWSPKSKIRNGEALRLCLDCLPRLWWPSRLDIDNAPSP